MLVSFALLGRLVASVLFVSFALRLVHDVGLMFMQAAANATAISSVTSSDTFSAISSVTSSFTSSAVYGYGLNNCLQVQSSQIKRFGRCNKYNIIFRVSQHVLSRRICGICIVLRQCVKAY